MPPSMDCDDRPGRCAGENHTSEVLKELRDGGGSSLSGVLRDIAVDSEP
jgi:hypothetical protein